MIKSEWNSPVLEILSTRDTAAGGQAAPDVFHSAPSGTQALPSGTLPPQS